MRTNASNDHVTSRAALKRRAERLRLRQELAAKQAAEREAEKAENEDMARARAEIELWREEQFDMLNQMAEVTRKRKEQEEKKRRAQLKDADLSGSSRLGTDQSNDKEKDQEAAKDNAVAEATAISQQYGASSPEAALAWEGT